LPAGTGHKRISASKDFKVAGAYPDGMEYNLRKASSFEIITARNEIKKVALPDGDPVYG
jgi:uncharacterized protein YjlB